VAGATTIDLDVVGGGDVADPPVALERQDVGVDRVMAERLERERADEFHRGSRHQDSHVGALVLEEPQQLDGLVRRDRSCDPQGNSTVAEPSARLAHFVRSVMMWIDPAALPAQPTFVSLAFIGSPLASAHRIARPLSVSSGSIASTPGRLRAHGAAERPPVRTTWIFAGSTFSVRASSVFECSPAIPSSGRGSR
jgi:hypothetical protein